MAKKVVDGGLCTHSYHGAMSRVFLRICHVSMCRIHFQRCCVHAT